MDITKFVVPEKVSVFEYNSIPGFEVELAYQSTEKLQKLRDKCVTQKLNKKTRQYEEQVNLDLFKDLYNKAIVKGWRGLKVAHLEKLMPVQFPPDTDLDVEVPANEVNITTLMNNSPEFNRWVAEQIEDLENFTMKKSHDYTEASN